MITGQEASTGWRKVQIGQPAQGRAVPIIQAGPQKSSIDIVFIPDRVTYPNGATSQDFLLDVTNAITGAFYGQAVPQVGIFNQHQEQMNFWIAQDTGVASNDSQNCALEPPANWNSDYVFADVGAIVHKQSIRNCADFNKRLFTAEAGEYTTFLHEFGHAPFALADEYRGNGGYFQTPLYPNMYRSQADCHQDPLANGVSDACQPVKPVFSGWTLRVRTKMI